MKKILIRSVFFGLICSAGLVFASSSSNHFTVKFDTGHAYDVNLNDNVIAWKGLEGDDKGLTEKIPYKHVSFSKDIDIYQWNEKRGSFVTFIVNKKNLHAVTSTKTADNKEWLTKGKIQY